MSPIDPLPPAVRWRLSEFLFVLISGVAVSIAGALVAGLFVDPETQVGPFTAVVLVAQYVGHGLAIGLVTRRRGLSLEEGLGFEVTPRDLRYLVLGALLQYAILILFLPLFELLELEDSGQDLIDITTELAGTFSQVILVVTIAVVAPVIEELMFRGVLLGWLRPRLSAGGTIVVSSLIFAAAHVLTVDPADPQVLAQLALLLPRIFLIGVPLAWLTLRHGRLGPAIFMHAGFNLWTVLALVLPAE